MTGLHQSLRAMMPPPCILGRAPRCCQPTSAKGHRVKLAYLINTYPQPSHSFIRREVQALERMDWQIHRFALRSDRARLVDPADIAEDGRTEHILQKGLWQIAKKALPFAARRPGAALRSLRLALSCGARGAGGRSRHWWASAPSGLLAGRDVPCRALP